MRIAIDFTAFLPEMTGVDRYLKELVIHLSRIDRTNQYRVFHNREDRDLFRDSLGSNFSLVSMSARPRATRLFFQQVLLPLAATTWGADVVHSPSFIMPFARGRARHVLTVHDMTSFSHSELHNALRRSAAYRKMVLLSLRRADIVTTLSEASRDAIVEFAPGVSRERVRLAVPGIGPEFRPGDPSHVEEVVARIGLPRRYILCVGTIEPRKNLRVLLESYTRLVQQTDRPEHLVLAGRLGWGYEELLTAIRSSEVSDRVHLAGYVAPADLPAVYSGARLLVYPSVFEGFGFPPLESMACGVPAISTLSSSLVENLQGAAELVAPKDVGSLSDVMCRLLSDDVLWEKRRAQGLERSARFRWEETARQMLGCYEAALGIERRAAA